MKVEDVFAFYRNYFVPAYSDLVTIIDSKPEQIINELENVLSHISQYHNPDVNRKLRQENLKKTYNHLVRATLDCYKLLCVVEKRELEKFFSFCKGELTEIKERYLLFMKTFKDARRVEMENVGVDPLASLEDYRKAARIGREALELILTVTGNKPKVFVGFRYSDEDEVIAKKLISLFELEGFECISGKTAKAKDVNEKVREMIEISDGTIIIFTKDKELKEGGYTTSTWLNDEKSYTLGLKKPVLLFFEEDISTRYREGIQGDLEYIKFNREKLDDLIIKAIPYLRDFYRKIIDSKGIFNLLRGVNLDDSKV